MNIGNGWVRYVYLDSITKQRQQGEDRCRVISHITMGDHVGPFKQNPKNKQYFPAIYNFDPFTGEKLIWTSEAIDTTK